MGNKYDVVIIGAGIGGLVSGCYLTREKLSVLIIEQHNKPGGYCTSFVRNGYKFDVGVHYLGGIKNGILGKILEELEIKKEFKLHQYDPTDKIIMPDNTTFIRANPHDTKKELQKSFPREKENINKFFKFIMQKNALNIYSKIKKITFQELLDEFFKDPKLKSTLYVLIGNIGTPPKEAAAFPCIVLFKQYILDPGYYPTEGTIQKLPDALLSYFKSNGGKAIFSKKVTKIVTHDKKITGVVLDGKEKITADIVISNADVTQTMKQLLDIESKESKVVDTLIPSPSMFLVYLGLKNIDLKRQLGGRSNIYYFSSYNVNEMYSNNNRSENFNPSDWIVCSFPTLHGSSLNNEKHTVSILKFAHYNSAEFWDSRKNMYMEAMIDKLCELMPSLRNHIDLKFSATPKTFFRYTSNKNGAFAGWMSTLPQIKSSLLPQRTSINNLYLAGHWATIGYLPFGGIPNVAFSGRRVSMLVLNDIGKDWKYSNQLFY